MAQIPADETTTIPAPLPSPSPSPANDPAAALGLDLLEDAPIPSPGFVAKLQGEKPVKRIITATEQIDKDGFLFDRKFCVLGHNNRPRKSAGGLWEMRKDPETGKRYVRSEVLRRGNGAPIEAKAAPTPPPRPVLDLPGGDTPEELPGTPTPPEEAAPPVMSEAQQLAILCDSLFWLTAPMYSDSEAINDIRPRLQPAGLDALTSALAQCPNLPAVPWWAAPAMVYAVAVSQLVNHKKSASKVQTLKEKIARWWLNFKHGNRRQASAQAGAMQENQTTAVC